MEQNRSAYRGCLLGLAAGDALGNTVDSRSWEQIRLDYGPYGLRGYDMANGGAVISAHTQLAAFTANGLLLGLTHGVIRGHMAPFVQYAGVALREWAQLQRSRTVPGRTFCWVSRAPELRTRRCADTVMLDTLTRERRPAPGEPVNRFVSPGAVASAVGVGLFSRTGRLPAAEAARLGMEVTALTHGGATALVTGAVIAHLIGLLVRKREAPLAGAVKTAADRVCALLEREYPQAAQVRELLHRSVSLAMDDAVYPVEALEQLRCTTAAEALAGAVYACLVCGDDFDTTMVTAVNHSGASAAVGALAGAIQGLRLGEAGIPDFYLEGLAPAQVLGELAQDLALGCPAELDRGMFDDDWDRKYVQGGM